MTEHETPAGVMDATYAEGRRRRPHLEFRFQVRARVAVELYRRRGPRADSHRVLDLGAADGRTLARIRELLEGHGDYHGVELSDSLLAVASDLPANVTLLRGDITALPDELKSGSYDLCTALAVLEHLREPLRAMTEAYRMLRPGGVFVATCPHPIWDEIADRLGMLLADDAHEEKLGKRELLEYARRAGFEDAAFEPFMWAPLGALPYVGVRVPPDLALRIDRWVQRVPFSDFGFVNQALVGTKPSRAEA